MLSKTLYTFFFIFISLHLTAQVQVTTVKLRIEGPTKAIKKHLCVNDHEYSPQELMSMEPFANAAKVKVILPES